MMPLSYKMIIFAPLMFHSNYVFRQREEADVYSINSLPDTFKLSVPYNCKRINKVIPMFKKNKQTDIL